MERLLTMLENGFITPEEYFKKVEEYEQRLYRIYLEGKITLDELCEKLDK
jgi:hypothetical protein